jgi:spore coat protein JC
MWIYEKRLIYPVNIKKPNLHMAKLLLAQYGGANSELSAGVNYLNQRYSMPYDEVKSILTDIGTEELAHWEMLGAMITQCLRGASMQEIKQCGMSDWYVSHRRGSFPVSQSGEPWTASYVGCTGDPVADLTNDLAAEQQARATYEGLIDVCEDPSVIDPLGFLREREIVHFQRFGEALDIVQSKGKTSSMPQSCN